MSAPVANPPKSQAAAAREQQAPVPATPSQPIAHAGAGLVGFSGNRRVPKPVNEPVRMYAPGSPERAELKARLSKMAAERIEIPIIIGGKEIRTGDLGRSVMPHAHKHVLAEYHKATPKHAEMAIAAAREAWREWSNWPWEDRAAVMLKAAELLATTWRSTLNAATMLGQSKTAIQAEIDAACELIDFWRFNVQFARNLLSEQPISSPGVWNRTDHRPLEGFVYAITPFNFTAIAGNLPTAPALMGNTVIWKPSPTQQVAAHLTMELLEEAGMPPGVINMVTGHGREVSEVALAHPEFAGRFRGSIADSAPFEPDAYAELYANVDVEAEIRAAADEVAVDQQRARAAHGEGYAQADGEAGLAGIDVSDDAEVQGAVPARVSAWFGTRKRCQRNL